MLRAGRSPTADILNASKNRSFKLKAIAAPAYGLADDGALTERPVRFMEQFLNLTDPRTRHHVQVGKVMPPARPATPLPKPTTTPADEPGAPPAFLVELAQVLLALSLIWLVVDFVRGRRTA